MNKTAIKNFTYSWWEREHREILFCWRLRTVFSKKEHSKSDDKKGTKSHTAKKVTVLCDFYICQKQIIY